MTAFLLFLVVVALLSYLGWSEYQHVKERRHLTHLLIAKRPSEVAVMERAVSDPPRPKITVLPEDIDPFWESLNAQTGI